MQSMAKRISEQMEMFEPVERGFDRGGMGLRKVETGEVFDFNAIANDYNQSVGKELITGQEMAALFDAFIDMKTAAKASGMNEGGVSLSAADIEKAKQDAEKITALKKQKTDKRLDKLDAAVTEKAKKTRDQMTKLTEMLTSGDVKKLSPEEQENFVKLYKLLQSQGYNEGGLAEEGGSVDPVSGNSVPPGSTKEEVRDDIPAQLSEGEFVFPADVVRYIGLEKLMMMRQEAKMGLAAMEAMGQMGNSEEATMLDDLPFDMYDLDIEDDNEYNMAQGGVVKMQQGGTNYTPPTIGGFVAPPPVTTGFSGPQPVQPFQSGQTQFQVAGAAEGAVTPKTSIDPVVPTFSDFVGQNIPGVDFTMVTFYDENGQAKVLKKFPDGSFEDPANPGVKVNPTDMGLTEEMKTKTTSTTQQQVGTAKVVDEPGNDKDGGTPPGASIPLGGTAVGKPKGIGIPFTRYAGPSRRVEGATIFNVEFDIPGFVPNPISIASFYKDMLSKDGPGIPKDGVARISVRGGTVGAHKVRVGATDYNKIRNDVTGDLAKEYQAAGNLAEALANGSVTYDGSKQAFVDNDGNKISDDLAKGLDKLGESIYADVKDDRDDGDTMIEAGQNLSDSEKSALSAYNDQQFSDFFDDAGKDDTPSAPEGAIGFEGQDMSGGDGGGAQSSDASADTSAADDSGFDFGGSVFKSGGLAKQMKRSGLASKK